MLRETQDFFGKLSITLIIYNVPCWFLLQNIHTLLYLIFNLVEKKKKNPERKDRQIDKLTDRQTDRQIYFGLEVTIHYQNIYLDLYRPLS